MQQNNSQTKQKIQQDLNASQEIDKKKRTICSTDLEMKFKIVLVGDSNVGKTSIFWRYIEDYYEDDQLQESTVTMVDFRMKNQIIDSDLVKLYIWDTAGQERYRSVISTYFKGAHAIIGVFDLTDPNSFQSLSTHWIKQCREKSGNAIFVLVGNKTDLIQKSYKNSENSENIDENNQQNRNLDYDNTMMTKIQQFCQEQKVEYVEVSAKTGEGIEDMFIKLAITIRDKFFQQQQKQVKSNNNQQNNLDSVQSKQQKQQEQNLQEEIDRPSFTISSNSKKQQNSKSKQKNKKDGCC